MVKQTASMLLVLLAVSGCASAPIASSDRDSLDKTSQAVLTRLPVPDSLQTNPVAVQLVGHEQPASDGQAFATRLAQLDVENQIGAEAVGASTLEELLATAVANNPRIQSARRRASALGWRVPQVTSLNDPSLSATPFLDAIETAAGRQEAILSLKQQFPWFGKLALRGQAASQESLAASAEALAIELSVIEQVKLAYYQIYFLDGAIQVNQTLKPELQKIIEIVSTKNAVNQAGLESVLEAEVELTQLITNIVELEQARKRALAQLIEAMSLPNSGSLAVDPALRRAALPDDGELLVQMVESCQPELQARMFDIGRDRTSVSLAYKDYLPDFTFGFNWYSVSNGGISPVSNGDDAYSLIAGINLPIYRNRLRAGVNEARNNVSRSVREYEATRDRLESEVRSLHATAIEQTRVLEYLEEDILPKSEETLTLSIESYRQDRIDFEQLIDNYEALLRFRIEQFQRQSLREQAIARLERQIGCAVATWPNDEAPAEMVIPQ